MASLLPPEPPPSVPKQDKREPPPPIRQELVDLHAEYPEFHPHELATICFVKFGRKPSPQTVKWIRGLRSSTVSLSSCANGLQRWMIQWNGDEPFLRFTQKAGTPSQ